MNKIQNMPKIFFSLSTFNDEQCNKLISLL
jgi:hypothetical protein